MDSVMVFDTSAWFTLAEAEAGADKVEANLAEAWLGRVTVHGSFVSLTELEYIRTREQVLSELSNRRPHQEVYERFFATTPAARLVCTVTLQELRYGAAIHPQPEIVWATDGYLLVNSVIQQNDAIGKVFLQAMTSVRVLSLLAGNDGRNVFFLQPSEKPFYLQAKNAVIGEARKERSDLKIIGVV